MRADQASETALASAAFRAAHRLHDSELVFDDTLAADLTSEEWRDRLVAGEVAVQIDQLGLRRVQGQLVVRMRYLEDQLERAVADGIGQYVLLGAGLDSFAWRRRDLAGRLRMIELDHPATQGYKRARLQELGLTTPEGVELVPVDFERTSLEAALEPTAFDAAVPAFFSWMGVVGYLTPGAFEATLASLAALASGGSRLVFDYPIVPELVPEADRSMTRTVDRGTADMGEVRRLKQRPADVCASLAAVGFETLEDLSAAALDTRYFAGRADGLRANPEVHIGFFERRR